MTLRIWNNNPSQIQKKSNNLSEFFPRKEKNKIIKHYFSNTYRIITKSKKQFYYKANIKILFCLNQIIIFLSWIYLCHQFISIKSLEKIKLKDKLIFYLSSIIFSKSTILQSIANFDLINFFKKVSYNYCFFLFNDPIFVRHLPSNDL